MTTKEDKDEKKTMQSKKIDKAEAKIKKYEKEIKQLRQELKEKNDKLLRSYADLQNFQKRMEKEVSMVEEETKKKYLSEILDVNELLQKAYKDKDPKKGLETLLRHIEQLFERESITYIDCVGKTFDHNCHHAISTVEKENCKDGEIIDEVKKGYLIGDKLLRPSQVIVAKKKG
jgi:molecular chaperone GrpE